MKHALAVQQLQVAIAPDEALPTNPLSLTVPKTVRQGHPLLTDLLALELWRTCQVPIAELEVLEHCDRIFLVAFTPHRAKDPVLPIALVDLGDRYRQRLQSYIAHLLIWRPSQDQADWNQKAVRCLDRLLAQLGRVAHKLTAEELTYLRIKLALAAARPNHRSDEGGI